MYHDYSQYRKRISLLEHVHFTIKCIRTEFTTHFFFVFMSAYGERIRVCSGGFNSGNEESNMNVFSVGGKQFL